METVTMECTVTQLERKTNFNRASENDPRHLPIDRVHCSNDSSTGYIVFDVPQGTLRMDDKLTVTIALK